MSLLEEIFRNTYSIELPQTPEYQALREKGNRFWEYIEERAGEKKKKKYWDDFADMEAAGHFHYFREGFLLGASLMLELRS